MTAAFTLVCMERTSRRLVLLTGLFACATSSLFAQSIEVGGTLGLGARGSEGSLVRSEARLIGGAHVGAWWADRVETAVRVAWLDLPRESGIDTYYTGCQVDLDIGRCRPTGSVRIVRQASARRFVAGQALYHFQRGRPVRPYAGVGIGLMLDRERLTCEVAGCERLLPGLPLGTRRSSARDVTAIGGLSALIAGHIVLRGGVQFHRPAGEDLSLFETLVGVGYRF